jgi:LytS/YehU family sensor histidine kinase
VFRSYSVSITKTITIEFCYLIFITSDYYAISDFIIPRFLHKRKYALFVVATLFVIAFSSWLRALVALQMNLHFFQPKTIIDFGTLYLNSVVNISLWVLLITIGKMLIDRMQTQQQLEFLEKERVKNELDYLKAQINPHALFNSLNTIYGHIDKTNQVARNILLQFSELLRYQLYDCAAEKVILEKEVEYVTNYVAFQRLRKSENLVVALEIENIESGLNIAPLLLVVLIENAFKFVSNFSGKENKIEIKIFIAGTTLHSSFFNTKEVQQIAASANSNGIGIVNLKRRLELLYPQKYKLTTKMEDDFYETNLTIDLT